MLDAVPPVIESGAASGDFRPNLSAEAIDTNRRWIRDLSGAGFERESACKRLFELLLRTARAESWRRASHLGLSGPELDDIAHQSAADALLTITAKLDDFRGDSKFTTWAHKFVVFDVTAKMNRHFWRHAASTLKVEDWNRLPDHLGTQPEVVAESRDLVNAVRRAADETLTPRQRRVFVAIVLNRVPTGVLADQLGSTQNSIYKMVFDIRQKLRDILVASGHLPPRQVA